MRRWLLLLGVVAPLTAAAEQPKAWELSASIYGYAVGGSGDFVNPGLTADRGRLHLEVRYNYEELDTASVWAGANFSAGETWAFEATAMLGVVFGEVDGVAPGFRMSLLRGWFEATSEGEYFIDSEGHEGNFLYSWTELAGYPTERLRLGLAFQRTRVYDAEIEISRGFVAGYTYKAFDVAAYVFNPDRDDTVYALGLSLDF